MEIEKKFDDICGNLQFRKKEEEICKYEKFYGYICNFPYNIICLNLTLYIFLLYYYSIQSLKLVLLFSKAIE